MTTGLHILECLPTELLHAEVFARLSDRELARLACVCQWLKKEIEGDMFIGPRVKTARHWKTAAKRAIGRYLTLPHVGCILAVRPAQGVIIVAARYARELQATLVTPTSACHRSGPGSVQYGVKGEIVTISTGPCWFVSLPLSKDDYFLL